MANRARFDAQTELETSLAHARGLAFVLGQAQVNPEVESKELTYAAIGALESLLETASDAFRRMTKATGNEK